MQETRNNCFGSKKRSTTLLQVKTVKHEFRNATATYVAVAYIRIILCAHVFTLFVHVHKKFQAACDTILVYEIWSFSYDLFLCYANDTNTPTVKTDFLTQETSKHVNLSQFSFRRFSLKQYFFYRKRVIECNKGINDLIFLFDG